MEEMAPGSGRPGRPGGPAAGGPGRRAAAAAAAPRELPPFVFPHAATRFLPHKRSLRSLLAPAFCGHVPLRYLGLHFLR
jgi:hypothetical protein